MTRHGMERQSKHVLFQKKKKGISKRTEQALIMTKVDVKSVLFLKKRLSKCLPHSLFCVWRSV